MNAIIANAQKLKKSHGQSSDITINGFYQPEPTQEELNTIIEQTGNTMYSEVGCTN
jgi:hypothetical protein